MKLTRNPEAVLSKLVNNGTQVLTKEHCIIQVPERYIDKNLGQIGIDTFVYGCFVIILDSNEYAVCNINGLIELSPSKTLKTTIDDIDYYEFHFEPNTVVIKDINIIRRDTIMYDVFDELIFKAKLPWFMDYEDTGKLFDHSKYYADSNVGENNETIELIVSIITRGKNKRETYIRHIANDYKDININTIDYVPIQSVLYSVRSTTNKMLGNYLQDGITGALVNPNDSVEKLEAILRA